MQAHVHPLDAAARQYAAALIPRLPQLLPDAPPAVLARLTAALEPDDFAEYLRSLEPYAVATDKLEALAAASRANQAAGLTLRFEDVFGNKGEQVEAT